MIRNEEGTKKCSWKELTECWDLIPTPTTSLSLFASKPQDKPTGFMSILRLSGLPHTTPSLSALIFVWLTGNEENSTWFYLFSPETTYNFAGLTAAVLPLKHKQPELLCFPYYKDFIPYLSQVSL